MRKAYATENLLESDGDLGDLERFALASASRAASKEKVLYAFKGGNDGEGPAGYPILDASGNLYGATVSGGPYGLGTVFELARSGKGWKESVLHSFGSGNDGANPYGLTIDGSGNMYGTTSIGGGAQKLCSEGCGTGVRFESDVWEEVEGDCDPPFRARKRRRRYPLRRAGAG